MKSIRNRIRSFRYIYVPLLFLMRPTAEKYEITHESFEPKRKKFWPTEYPQQKILDPHNIHEEYLWTHETQTRKKFGPTKYLRENIFDPRYTHEKKYLTHDIPTRKHFAPAKHPREDILNLRNTHDSEMARWH